MTPLDHLTQIGTSVWIDGLVPPAELERLVREGVTGLTSNPTIFRAAVLETDRYATRIAGLGNRSPVEAYEALAVEDVQAAADILAPVHARTRGADGFVSLEVAPELADDVHGTVDAVRRVWARVDRPNVMIKIPGTTAGVEATRRATADGINVNVTLLFSVERYAAVIDAYLAGLEERVRHGGRIRDVSSVASFFVSRVDTAVDRLLADRGREDLAGQAGVANARLAFAHASTVFNGPGFETLRAAGARPQRLLWASTGTKDPRYSDVKYVEELAGPGVINTMPPMTLAAFRDHGVARDMLTGSGSRARANVKELARAGIDFEEVNARLLHEGVAKFAASMDELLVGLRTPTDRVTSRPSLNV
jgi:transaldolase